MNLKFQPTTRNIYVVLALFIASATPLLIVQLKQAFLWAVILIGLISFVDLIYVLFKPKLSVQRNLPHNLPVGKKQSVDLTIHNLSKRDLSFEIFDNHPISFSNENLPNKAKIPKQQKLLVKYKIEPLQRGDYDFPYTEFRMYSPLKLWTRQFKVKCKTEVKVYPNFADMKYLSLLAADNQLSRMGIYIQQMRGSGLEFNQLREYQQGDSPRQVDWHASAKHNKLISKEFQEERDQEIICLLDCSRRMRGMEKGKPFFDHALNAMIQLGQIIVRQGDAFGFLAYSGYDRWFKPRKGFAAINSVLNKVYDLKASNAPSDYLLGAERILKLQKKRALIVIITNSRNEDASDLLSAVHLLQRKHLVVIADIRDPALDDIANEKIQNFEESKLYLHSMDYLQNRKDTHKRLLHKRLMMLDTRCEELPLRLIQSYYEIKRMHSL